MHTELPGLRMDPHLLGLGAARLPRPGGTQGQTLGSQAFAINWVYFGSHLMVSPQSKNRLDLKDVLSQRQPFRKNNLSGIQGGHRPNAHESGTKREALQQAALAQGAARRQEEVHP